VPDDTHPSSPTVAWFHCFSGIAGDMALGALVDAGADLGEVRQMCERLPVGGWALEAEAVSRSGIAGTKIHVRAEETTVVRTAAHVTALVEEARLPDRVRQRALATFHALAVAEGRLHRRPPEQVHFHEVGGIDAIVDIVGTCAALEVLDIHEVASSPVANGTGMVRTAHGLMPNPAPAVMALLEGAPTYGLNIGTELTTPTGAALLAAMVVEWGPLPDVDVASMGFGAGTAELDDRPNLTQVVIGARHGALDQGQPVVLLEANVDDITGEQLAHAIASLLDAGAHDAWVTPIVMKKGRPAHTVSALADVALADQVASTLVMATGTLGVRGQTMQRWPQARHDRQVEVDGLPVRVKVGTGRVKVENDDAARVARRTGRSVREVVSIAEERWRHQQHEHGHLHGLPTGDGEDAS
jgi:pyridinium-3,5-bisthiocarboxylic acid mononucleotide nickel chelatase